ncbi:hypothetical protein KAR91_32855 [Candidatus Pacearchaeota archaeon]|nr:hypothetical protein [Candidatus Pacearchaeota archaeon]
MGIDYESVGGIGIELTSERVDLIIEKGFFTEDAWDEDSYECVEEIGLLYGEGGNSYSRDTTYYLLVEGKTLKEINGNATAFVKRLDEIGIKMSIGELEVIDDYRVY